MHYIMLDVTCAANYGLMSGVQCTQASNFSTQRSSKQNKYKMRYENN